MTTLFDILDSLPQATIVNVTTLHHGMEYPSDWLIHNLKAYDLYSEAFVRNNEIYVNDDTNFELTYKIAV